MYPLSILSFVLLNSVGPCKLDLSQDLCLDFCTLHLTDMCCCASRLSVHGPKLELVKVKCNEHITDLGFSRIRILLSKLALISPYCFHSGCTVDAHPESSLRKYGLAWQTPPWLWWINIPLLILCLAFSSPPGTCPAESSMSMIKQHQVLHPQAGWKKWGKQQIHRLREKT